MRLKLLTACLLLPALVSAPGKVRAQAATKPVKAAATKKPPVDSDAGLPLTADSDVPASVTVDAVLLPYDVAKRTFSKEVADRYAVVQLTVSNQNPNASLILQSVFLDDRHWLFSGNLSVASIASDGADAKKQYHSVNDPMQVSSVEARIVRGELQDAQPFTLRNLLVRSAVAVGTIASGFQYLSASANVLAGISAYGNQAVPALGLLWPDLSQARINRISDFGFQTNKVIGKSSSDIVVAFFPLERFLTPTLRSVYKKAPAAFFNPLELILDDKYSKPLYDQLHRAGVLASDKPADQRGEIAAAFSAYETDKLYRAKFSACAQVPECEKQLVVPKLPLAPEQETMLAVINRASLNNIRVVVGGIMTVDENAVPATITSIVPDTSDTTPLKAGAHKVVLTGTFLENGVPSVVEADALKITDVKAVADQSTDTKMVVTYQLANDIADATTAIHFVVTKTAKDGTQTVSSPGKLSIVQVSAITALTPADAGEGAWTAASHKARLMGTNIDGCSPAVINGAALGVSSIAVDTTAVPAASATSVPITYRLSKELATATTIPIFCTLPPATVNDTPVNTKPFTYTVKY